MNKIQLFLFLISSFYVIQLCTSKPALFEGYRKKQQKIRETRLKKSIAETRLIDLSNKHHRRIEAKKNAINHLITTFHTTRSEWIKKDMQYTEIEENMRRHKLIAKILKYNPEINDIFHSQANNLKKQSKEIRKQRDEIKGKGQNNYSNFKAYRKNHKEDEKAYQTYERKSEKCIEKISKYNKIIHRNNRCNIL